MTHAEAVGLVRHQLAIIDIAIGTTTLDKDFPRALRLMLDAYDAEQGDADERYKQYFWQGKKEKEKQL